MALVELPPQTSNILASWQEVLRALPMAKSPVDAQINQNITDTIMLLKMLTVQADQKPIYARDLGALQDQVNAMQNQMNTITEECNAAEVAICLLHTELAEACNVANALAHATPAAAAAATSTPVCHKPS